MKYINNLFFSFDRFLNALCGGSPVQTISARVGYHTTENTKWHSKYWNGLRAIIDSTFYPADGEGHCAKAYEDEKFYHNELGNDFARIILGIIVTICCVFLWPTIRILKYWGKV